MSKGYTPDEIGERMNLSAAMVRKHLMICRQKLGVKNNMQLGLKYFTSVNKK